ncbi:phospholipase D-like domain-containing protein [Mangrovicoccus sp. HB161399]|uniref:phospholipase D-like domain-containing protein n=1 Tax=Mangrovicoccus sp. HB161399 TaxID=2720392 RepID=UPI001557B03D|nr:phospholipase D-like domain-containing protein [Mangrovicoccus sp. HB161399]
MDALAARAPEALDPGSLPAPARETRLRQLCLTASEAYPALEEAFLSARREIHASFRVFDPATQLRGERARAAGKTWADLVAHVLGKGVHVTLVLSDFDAIARPELHRMANAHARALERLRSGLPGGAGRLTVRLAPHPARMGLLPRLALLPVIRKHLSEHAAALNGMAPAERQAALEESPGIAQHLEERGGKLRVKRLILPDVLPATHHQKLAVFDRSLLYIGGLDLDERRWDTPEHRRAAADTWHDVQVLMEGPVVQEAQAHLDRFLDETAGRQAPVPGRELLRTLSAARKMPLPFFGPRTLVAELNDVHLEAISRAERMIYLETQFLRDTRLARALARRGREVPELQLVVVLPAAPEDVAFNSDHGIGMRHAEALQVRCLKMLGKAYGRRAYAVCPVQPRAAAPDPDGERDTVKGAPQVYVHAKVSVFDDAVGIVSSANLNGRSLRWDTEAGVALRRPEEVAELRDRCMRHWIGGAFSAHGDAFRWRADAWRARARANAARAPQDRKGFAMPYPWAQADDFAVEVPGFPEEAV